MNKGFGYSNRAEYIKRLTSEIQDVIVIGGGITGAGILLDSTTRGMKASLFEMQDFAEGTSSRSTKLVHGGLRYLKQFEFSLVKEVGRERAIVFQNGPHVTKSEPMLLPIVEGGSIGTLGALFGMWLYDKLANVKEKEKRRILHKASVLAMEPSIRSEKLISGAYYYEYRTDDSRLTIEIIKEAVNRNALALNYCKVIGFLYNENKITGVKAKDLITNIEFEVKAKVVINATGPWVDETDKLDNTASINKLLLSKGVHIVVDASRLPIGQAMYFDVGDGRMIFAIPREGKVYIGTTESEYTGEIQNPEITKKERDYLLNAVNNLFNDCHLKPEDVESGWAGLRPLIKQKGKKPGEVSRKDETFIHPSGLISIAGGKLTGYRKMAERVTNIISSRLLKDYQLPFTPCITDNIKISGGNIGNHEEFEKYINENSKKIKIKDCTENEIKKIISRYGSNHELIFANQPTVSNSLVSKSLLMELTYSINYEMTISPLDFFIRRTSKAYFDIHSMENDKEIVLDYMGKTLNWTIEQKAIFSIDLNEKLNYLSSIKSAN